LPAVGGVTGLDVPGRLGWLARYLKDVDAGETRCVSGRKFTMTRASWSRRMRKFPVDKGHQKV